MLGVTVVLGLGLVLDGGTWSAGEAWREKRSAPVRDVHYEVTFNAASAARRTLHVSMRFRAEAAGPVLLSLPAWTPGAYEISNFARNVSGFDAQAENGRPLRWDRADHDTWRVQTEKNEEVIVRFDYLADSLDNAMAWSTPDFAFFNGTNVFLFPEDQDLAIPAQVTVQTEPGWQVATGMASTGRRGEFTAPNYHELVDMPVFVGRFDLDSLEIDGRWYRLASYPEGALSGRARKTFWEWTEKMLSPMTAVFGEVPWADYTTLLVFSSDYPGGSALEHGNSHIGIYNPQFIGNPILASITAHEIFHAWNVKRLRPSELVPYDYRRQQPTTLLWVSEGITDYYADLALVRGDIIPPALFYVITAGKIDNVNSVPPVALEDASLATWIQPADGTGYIYYPKGSLAGFLLDILIRDASNNLKSLDDVFRELYRTTYLEGTGFTEQQWWDAVQRNSGGRSYEEFWARYIDGRDPYPWDRVLPLAGLTLRADSNLVPRLGVSTDVDSAGVRVVALVPDGAAIDAGVRVGDYLTRVGDVRVRGAEFGDEFRARYARAGRGTPLDITVRRDGETVQLTGELRVEAEVRYAIEEDPRATTKARRIREGILRGTVER